MSQVTRPLVEGDASELLSLYVKNRSFLAPWEPARTDDFFTLEAQHRSIIEQLSEKGQGRCVPLVIVNRDGNLVGRISVNGITRGAFQSASIGYWVAEEANGRGLATDAVKEVVTFAFGELGLHRLQAETLLHNHASQIVLTRNAFIPIGVAHRYLKIAGRWQDRRLYQRLNES